MPNKGFIVLDRAMSDWQWWDNVNGLGLWIHILIDANWKDGWFMGNKVPRGSFATSIKRLAEETDMSEKTVRNWLKKFENAGQISVKGANKFTLITVINYAKYQDMPIEKGEQITEQITDQVTEQSTEQITNQSTDQVTDQVTDNRTNKPYINNKKKEKDITNVISSKKEKKGFVPPTVEEVQAYCDERHNFVDPEAFVAFYESKNWMIGKNKMSNWKKAVITWEKYDQQKRNAKRPKQRNLLEDLPF
jgi:DNA-binding Lrp family transcriptional regulator